jgi:hypothetical protein
VKLEELKKAGFLNADMSSTELYPGIDLIPAGKMRQVSRSARVSQGQRE